MKPTRGRWWLGIAALSLLPVAGCGDSGYTTTPSGLRYKDEVVGTGATPKSGERVEVQYTGWLRDGTKFDSSKDRSFPLNFVLGRREVIPGWDEGVATMKVGGTRKLLVPYKLAYGEKGYPPEIPPHADLIFEVELLGIYQTLSGGVCVQDLEPGTGNPVKKDDTVEINYTGWLTRKGQEFESTKGKGPREFVVGGSKVIPGLSQGVEGMKVGGKRRMIVPFTLGYGERGVPGWIDANAELLFEVELVKIK